MTSDTSSRVGIYNARNHRLLKTFFGGAAPQHVAFLPTLPRREACVTSGYAGTMQLRAEFFDVYLEMAIDFRLPLRMAGARAERLVGFPYRQLAAAEGVLYPDHFVHTRVGSRRAIEKALFDLRTGVTEMYLHPALDTDELRASHPDWPNRVEDHAMLTRDPAFADLIERAGAQLIGFRELRDLQRS